MASRLLSGLAAGCRQLEVLAVLPEPLSGLGDEHMALLAGLQDLQVGGWVRGVRGGYVYVCVGGVRA